VGVVCAFWSVVLVWLDDAAALSSCGTVVVDGEVVAGAVVAAGAVVVFDWLLELFMSGLLDGAAEGEVLAAGVVELWLLVDEGAVVGLVALGV
jgi:hypothetical protein